ncbi:MAG TPA: hypothetical protein VJC08_04350, partial [bacterium]|nr:hypothetical protein [bacterium]
GGILFLALRYGFPDSVYTRLDIVTKEQTLSNGEKLQTVLPFDGGAFQMLWPILTMPETQDPALNTMLRNFVTIALDYSRTHNLPGLLSASYGGIGEYAGNAGITDLSFNGAARNENVPSLYALGAARMIAPQAVDEFLEQILAAHPDLATEHGFWEGINISTGDVIQEQIVANVTSFILGLAGTGPKHMGRYLDQRGLSARLQSIYLAENSVDVIADSSNIYTWGNGNISSSHSGSEYSFSASQFYSSGTAFIQNGINISGKKLRIAYSSFGPPVTAKLEFKERARDGLELRHRESSLVFLNTSGQVREIEIDLPPSLALLSIDEIVLLITMGTGGSINLKIKKFEVVPQDFHDLIAGSTDVFSWGDNVAGYRWQKDEYRIQSQQFSSSGTAFLQKGINAAGGELRIRYRSSTPVGKVKFEFKERKSDGLQIQLEMHDIVFQNTGNKDQEIAIPLPMDVNLSKIDELVMLVSDGNGSPLDLVLVDLDIRLHHSVNLISESINHFTWGNGVSGQRDSGDEYLLRSDAFYSSGTAFIQNVGGINIAGKKLEIRYRSNSDVGKVKFEFKEQKADGLHIQYVTPEIQFVNTGGGERKIVIDLPALFELFNIHEAVMLISEGQGGPLDLRITQLAVTPQDSRDLIAESTGSFSWGENNIRGAGLRDSYFISSPSFYSSGTVFTQNNLDLSGNRFIRLRYQSIGSEIRSKLEFKVQQPDGVQTVYETEPIDLSNTQGSEKEILISLPAGLDLLGIDEVVLTLFGGSGRALDLTVLDLDIF